VTIGRSRLGGDHPQVAQSLSALSFAKGKLGEKDAEELARTAIEGLRPFSEERPVEWLRALNHWVAVLCIRSKFEAANEPSLEAVALGRSLPEEGWHELMKAMMQRGIILGGQGDQGGAEEANRQTLEVQKKALGERHFFVGETLNNLAANLFKQGKYEESEVLLQQSLSIRLERLGDDHPYLANSHYHLGKLLFVREKLDASAEHYRQSIEILHRAAPGNTRGLLVEIELAKVALVAGAPEKAERLLRDSLRRWRELKPKSWTLHAAESALGECLIETGRFEEAEEILRHSLKALQKKGKRDQAEAARQRLIALYAAWKKPEQAMAVQSLPMAQAAKPSSPPDSD
jgi:tetratricopeptide (TPR) repeat protein